MKKAIVLSSGGVDSTTCIGLAVSNLGADNVLTVSVSYGQKHTKELECAEKIAEYYGVEHKVIDLTQLDIFEGSDCSLLKDSGVNIKHQSYSEQIKENGEGKVDTYVPFRNGLLLSIVSAIAQSRYPDDNVEIYIGAHADDAAGDAYADCSDVFMAAMDSAINIGTYGQVRIVSPLVNMNKAEVVRTGLNLDVPYELTWSCYEGGNKPCGECGTCIDRAEAFRLNGVDDPALKEDK